MKVSEILNKGNIRQLFFVFFNLGTKENDEYFEFKILYRQSSKSQIILDKALIHKNNQLMSEYTELDFVIHGTQHFFRLENDLQINRHEFLNEVYRKIEQSRFNCSDDEFQEALYMGLFTFRGSMDLNRNLFAVDLLSVNVSSDYLNHITSLLFSSIGITQLNLNFRELQPEYIGNVRKRNTQVRINLKWFYTTYINTIGKINLYKASILKDNFDLINISSISNSVNNTFFERLLFYRDRIVNSPTNFKVLTTEQQELEIYKLRADLNFENENFNISDQRTRDRGIVQMASALLPDECVACKEKYNIMDRTFIRKSSRKPYLELHHVISFGSNNRSDVLENLVKLCPACHRALTPNRADEDYQKELINNIIKNSPGVDEYLDNFLSSDCGTEDKINFVYSKLS